MQIIRSAAGENKYLWEKFFPRFALKAAEPSDSYYDNFFPIKRIPALKLG